MPAKKKREFYNFASIQEITELELAANNYKAAFCRPALTTSASIHDFLSKASPLNCHADSAKKQTQQKTYKSLSDYHLLSSVEKRCLRDFLELAAKVRLSNIDAVEAEKVICGFIRKFTKYHDMTIRIAAANKLFSAYCQSKYLAEDWLREISKFEGKSELLKMANESAFSMLQPQINISNFDLFRGMIYSDLAQSIFDNFGSERSVEFFECLCRAAEHKNIFALKNLTNLYYQYLEIAPESEGSMLLEQVINSWSGAITHGALAFAELAEAHIRLATHYQKKDSDIEVNSALANALGCLHAAQLCKANSESARKNAEFFGLTFEETLPNELIVESRINIDTQRMADAIAKQLIAQYKKLSEKTMLSSEYTNGTQQKILSS